MCLIFINFQAMASCSTEENLSDDDVFFGKLTLKEVKKHIFFHDYRHSISCDNKTENATDSIKIIETHSEPDVYSIRDTEGSLDLESNFNSKFSPDKKCNLNSTDDSFLKIEKMVADLYVSPTKSNNDELDNTLEVVEYILNNASFKNNGNHNTEVSVKKEVQDKENNYNIIPMINISPLKITNATEDDNKLLNNNVKSKLKTELTPIESLYVTPVKNCITETNHYHNLKTDARTPMEEKKHSESKFKSPKNLLCPVSCSKKIGKINNYQHISSPVAAYIKSGPQIPLIQAVHPKKPLSGKSAIPKLLKSTSDLKVCNKENVLLPSVAYKTAKQTKMIAIPDKNKLPKSPWAQKVASTAPKSVVIKHYHREVDSKKCKIGSQEDSFANLSLHQAELSVCIQKSAFSNPK